jgi:hypothetical protein
MPKPAPVEFFEVTVRCPKEILGDLMSDINKRGLPDVHFNLVTAVASFRDNAPVNGIRSNEFLLAWIKEHPTFKAIEVRNAFLADGRTPGSCYPALSALVEKGILKKLGAGEYSRADVKAIPPPKKAKVKKLPTPAVSAHDFALRLLSRNHGKISSATLKKNFEADGRKPTGVGPVINRLLDEKKIRRISEGLYELAPAKPDKAEANGAAPDVREPANG